MLLVSVTTEDSETVLANILTPFYLITFPLQSLQVSFLQWYYCTDTQYQRQKAQMACLRTRLRTLNPPCVKCAWADCLRSVCSEFTGCERIKIRAAHAEAVGAKSIRQQGWQWCRRVIEMADKPVCFALGVGVVKGDQSAAVFRGSQAPLGRRGDRSPFGQQPTLLRVHPHCI